MGKGKYACKISQGLIIFFLPMVLLLFILQAYALNKNFYLQEFKKYQVSDATKIAWEDLDTITVKMIDYLKGKEDNLNMQVKINGNISEVFGEREKNHMIDVKRLFQYGHVLRNTGVFVLIISIIILKSKSNHSNKHIYKSLIGASGISLIAMVCLVLLSYMDFYKYFTYFHKIFFRNDLWLLNPETDVLIQMLPLEFFYDIAMRVIVSFIFIMAAVGGVCFYKIRKFSVK